MPKMDYKKNLEVDIDLLGHIVKICDTGAPYAARDAGRKLEVAYNNKAITRYEYEIYEDKIDASVVLFRDTCKCKEKTEET